MLKKTYRKAEIVLGILDDTLSEDVIYVETYQNGRENGFAVSLGSVFKFGTGKSELGSSDWIYFSENRNSDAIVVYISKTICLQSISEEAYKTAKHFEDFNSAAIYIVEKLKSSFKAYA